MIQQPCKQTLQSVTHPYISILTTHLYATYCFLEMSKYYGNQLRAMNKFTIYKNTTN